MRSLKVIFKLKNDGGCESIVLSDIFRWAFIFADDFKNILGGASSNYQNVDNSSAYPGLNMRGFNQHMMQAMCVGAGCDYLVRGQHYHDLNTFSNTDHRFNSATSCLMSCTALHCTTGFPEGMRRQEQLQTYFEARVLIVCCYRCLK